MKMMQLYGPGKDDEPIETIEGVVPFIDYLRAEKKRIEANPKRKAQIVSRFGFSWLMVNVVTKSNKKANSTHWCRLMPVGQRRVMP